MAVTVGIPWMASVGNDELFGEGGSDLLRAGSGADTLDGGSGDDTLSGDSGDDVLFGGRGSDLLDGGTGSNRYRGNGGTDALIIGTEDSFNTVTAFSLTQGDKLALDNGLTQSDLSFADVAGGATIEVGATGAEIAFLSGISAADLDGQHRYYFYDGCCRSDLGQLR